jgi:hypothetical protein
LSLFFLNGASRLDSPHPIPSWNRVGLWARIPPPLRVGNKGRFLPNPSRIWGNGGMGSLAHGVGR